MIMTLHLKYDHGITFVSLRQARHLINCLTPQTLLVKETAGLDHFGIFYQITILEKRGRGKKEKQ